MLSSPKLFYQSLLLCSLFFLLFFRSGIALRISGDFDERCYLANAERLVGISSSSCEGKSHFPGVGILWFPAAVMGRGVAVLLSESPEDWIAAFSGFSSFLMWCLTLFLIQRIALIYTSPDKKSSNSLKSAPFVLSLILLLNIPSFYFSFARTLMAHSGEVFLSFLFIYLVLRNKALYSALVLGLLILTRPNNFGAVLVYWAAFDPRNDRTAFKTSWGRPLFKAIKWMGLFIIVIGIVYFGFYKGYNGTFLVPSILNWNLEQVGLFFFRTDLGVVWNQTLWTTIFLFTYSKITKLKPFQEALLSWMTLSAFLTIFWPTSGSSFGYRYLLGSHAASVVLFLDLTVIYPAFFQKFKKTIGFFLSVGALWALNTYWSSTAPPPFWPWQDPFLKSLSPPYWLIENWWIRCSEMLRLIQFSSLGHIFCFFGVREPYLIFRGEPIPYFLDGNLKFFSLSLSFLALGVLLFSLFKLRQMKLK